MAPPRCTALLASAARLLWLATLWTCAPRPPLPGAAPDVIATAGVSPARLAASQWPERAGLHEVSFSDTRGHTRSATVWIPSAARPRVLVIALHGAIVSRPGRRPMEPLGVSRRLVTCLVEPALAPLEPLVIAPHSPTGQWWLEADTAFVLGLLAQARERWPELAARSVITGYSNGGIATWYFARLYPTHFGAAIPMAFDASIVGATPLAVYAIQGDSDELFDIARIRAAIAAERARGTEVTLIERHRAGHLEPCAYVPELSRAAEWLERTVWPRARAADEAPPSASQPDTDR